MIPTYNKVHLCWLDFGWLSVAHPAAHLLPFFSRRGGENKMRKLMDREITHQLLSQTQLGEN